MSALTEAEFGSDTDDDDYLPEGEVHEASEEENSGVEEGAEEGKIIKGRKKKKFKKVVSGRKSIFGEDSEKVDWKKELEEERKEIDEEKKKQKADDLFASFKRDTSSAKPTTTKKVSSISSLFDSSGSSTKEITAPAQAETTSSNKRFASLFDSPPTCQDSSDKSASDSSKPKSLLGALFDEDPKTKPSISEDKSESKEPDEKKPDKIQIKKVFDFAGEMVTVSKEVAANSTEAKKYLKSQGERSPEPTTGHKRPGGLAGIVSSIGKKQKMGVLDKSKLDWNSFVSEEGISEELVKHNKGKDG